jgi:hypothetical protein
MSLVLSKRIKSYHRNRGKDKCRICGVELEEGDLYFPKKLNGGGSGKHCTNLYCIPCAKEKNHL